MAGDELVLRVPHALGAAEARKRIAGGVEAASTQYGQFLQARQLDWQGNRLTFSLSALAQTISGTLDVADDHVELRAKLPLVIRMLAKRFVPKIEGAGQKLLR